MSDASTNEEPVDRIRRRLVEIADELRSLQADDFPGKHRLNTEADQLRSKLGSLVVDDAELRDSWAERAGRKGDHTADPEAARAAIVSPGDSGSI